MICAFRIDRKIRRKQWFAVPAPNEKDIDEAISWCKKQTSVGKFYYHYTNVRWWFELEQDAMMFLLRWQ